MGGFVTRAAHPRAPVHSKLVIQRRRLSIAQWFEACANFVTKKLRLFPGSKVSASVEFVVMDKFGISPFRPSARCGIDLVWKDADGHRDGNVLRLEKDQLVLPIEPS